ncbi:MAG TPA: hypothetical protein VHK91_18335 [Flavisolibacter sp.]|nr:hypothetical protein [Flavisolibacter sp.]
MLVLLSIVDLYRAIGHWIPICLFLSAIILTCASTFLTVSGRKKALTLSLFLALATIISFFVYARDINWIH